MATTITALVRCVSIQGAYDQAEAIAYTGDMDVKCNCTALFTGENGIRIEVPVTDWQYASLISRTFQKPEDKNYAIIEFTLHIPF